MPKPQRIKLSRRKGWRLPDNTIVVARPSQWGNPFVVGVDGDSARCVELYRYLMAGNVCLTCKADAVAQERTWKVVHFHRDELRGKNLACWCALDKPCHADVLLEIANR